MTMTAVDVRAVPPIEHAEAKGLAEEEYRRFAELLATVRPEQRAHPTDCTAWTVRDVAGADRPAFACAPRPAGTLRGDLRRAHRQARRKSQGARPRR